MVLGSNFCLFGVNGGVVHGRGFESLIQSVQSSTPYFTDPYSNYTVSSHQNSISSMDPFMDMRGYRDPYSRYTILTQQGSIDKPYPTSSPPVDQDNKTVLHTMGHIKDPHYNARPNNVPNHVTTQWRQPCFI
jgi:hypothetical protein